MKPINTALVAVAATAGLALVPAAAAAAGAPAGPTTDGVSAGTAATAGRASAATLTLAYLRGGDIYVATGANVKRLTTDGHGSRPRWSPDGLRLAYLSSTALWIMNADGSGKHQVARTATGGPSWSPDGRWLAFVGPDCHGTLDVLKVASTGAGKPVSLLPGSPCAGQPGADTGAGMIQPVGGTIAQRMRRDTSVAWSPNGRSIAFTGGECTGVYDECLSVADLTTGSQTTLDAYGGGGLIFSGFGVAPAWRPDGARLSWTAYTDGESPETSQPVHVVESDGAGGARRTIGVADDRELAYLNPGQAVLTSTHAGGSWLTLVDLSTGARTYLRPGSQASPRP